MAEKSEFFAAYERPEWQRKRLEIFERDDFKCVVCGAADRQLYVHHGYYERNFKPWDYPNETLHTVCGPCHVEKQELYNEIKRAVGRLDLRSLKGALDRIRLRGDLAELQCGRRSMLPPGHPSESGPHWVQFADGGWSKRFFICLPSCCYWVLPLGDSPIVQWLPLGAEPTVNGEA